MAAALRRPPQASLSAALSGPQRGLRLQGRECAVWWRAHLDDARTHVVLRCGPRCQLRTFERKFYPAIGPNRKAFHSFWRSRENRTATRELPHADTLTCSSNE